MSRRYSPQEIEQGLAALVVAGNSLKASEITGVPDKTIREWKRKNLERYEQLRTELHSKVAGQIASDAELMAQRLTGLEHQLIDKLEERIDELPARDLHPALRNITTSKALQMDKISGPLRERPAYMPPGQDVEALMNDVRRMLGTQQVANQAAIESTATDVDVVPVSRPSQREPA